MCHSLLYFCTNSFLVSLLPNSETFIRSRTKVWTEHFLSPTKTVTFATLVNRCFYEKQEPLALSSGQKVYNGLIQHAPFTEMLSVRHTPTSSNMIKKYSLRKYKIQKNNHAYLRSVYQNTVFSSSDSECQMTLVGCASGWTILGNWGSRRWGGGL